MDKLEKSSEEFPFKDGDYVRGMTYTSIDHDRELEEVNGILHLRDSPFGGPPQCWIGANQVDPSTLEEITESDEYYEG